MYGILHRVLHCDADLRQFTENKCLRYFCTINLNLHRAHHAGFFQAADDYRCRGDGCFFDTDFH